MGERLKITNKGPQNFRFYGSKNSYTHLSAREKEQLKQRQLLNQIDEILSGVWAEFDALDNKRTRTGYFLMSLHDKLNALKSGVNPAWRHDINKQ